MCIAIPTFYWFTFAWSIFLHPLTFCRYMSLGLKWISCRQHICGSRFCIHSASLCLLVGAFNPFIFKVINTMCILTAILLIVLDFFCGPFFSPSSFVHFYDLMINLVLCLDALFSLVCASTELFNLQLP